MGVYLCGVHVGIVVCVWCVYICVVCICVVCCGHCGVCVCIFVCGMCMVGPTCRQSFDYQATLSCILLVPSLSLLYLVVLVLSG